MPPLILTRSFFVSPAAPQLYHGHSQPAICQTPFAISHQFCILRPLSSSVGFPSSAFRPPTPLPSASRFTSSFALRPISQFPPPASARVRRRSRWRGGASRRAWSPSLLPALGASPLSALGTRLIPTAISDSDSEPLSLSLSAFVSRRSALGRLIPQFAITTVRLRSLVETATAVLTKRYGSQWLVST